MLLLESVPMAQGSLGTTSANLVQDWEEWVDLWITDILCDPGYPDSTTQPWVCASAACMELIKL